MTKSLPCADQLHWSGPSDRLLKATAREAPHGYDAADQTLTWRWTAQCAVAPSAPDEAVISAAA